MKQYVHQGEHGKIGGVGKKGCRERPHEKSKESHKYNLVEYAVAMGCECLERHIGEGSHDKHDQYGAYLAKVLYQWAKDCKCVRDAEEAVLTNVVVLWVYTLYSFLDAQKVRDAQEGVTSPSEFCRLI